MGDKTIFKSLAVGAMLIALSSVPAVAQERINVQVFAKYDAVKIGEDCGIEAQRLINHALVEMRANDHQVSQVRSYAKRDASKPELYVALESALIEPAQFSAEGEMIVPAKCSLAVAHSVGGVYRTTPTVAAIIAKSDAPEAAGMAIYQGLANAYAQGSALFNW